MGTHITIIGTGYIGLVAGACLADLGHKVTCVDIDEKKIQMLLDGGVPIYEPGLSELISKNVENLTYTTSYEEALKNCEVCFIAVGTPSAENGEADLRYVMSAAKSIGEHMSGNLIVVNRSTIPVGTGHQVEKTIQAETDHEVSVISCPEFLREGCAINDFMNPDRVVIGADTGHETSVEVLKKIYSGVIKSDDQFVVTDLKSAEMIKYASNSFLATQISYINDLSELCEVVGVDVTEVARGMKLDKRIGAHAFLSAGLGYGGSCFPKDVQALIALSKKEGCNLPLLETVEVVNNQQIERAFNKVEKLLKGAGIAMSEATIGFLGLSFKPGTDDTRESQSIKLLNRLVDVGAAQVRVVDPIVNWEDERVVTFKDGSTEEQILHAADGADILILATEWEEFCELDLEKLSGVMTSKLLLDLRNVYDKSELEKWGFSTENMGR